MKKIILIYLLCVILASCAPVLSQSYLQSGIYNPDLNELKENPDVSDRKLFILGGIIVKTTATKEGSLIEALSVPVDSKGYMRGFYRQSRGRFMAIYKSRDILDPMIYSKRREITLAGEFIGLRKGTIGEMEYDFPFFEIKEIYLWEEYKGADPYYFAPYPPPYYYPPYYRGHFWDRHYYPNYYSPWWY